ncbi:hypothetical protein AWC19_26610 [Mycobacterium palustre]|uniref:Uncharacterized protein n=2 Tax=Mycobacterium palustre TaxID=153971 RepID=A0A1X1ZX85_9MYCO|nr:hypothetical protein AWC19_26610 [Mycobacterium palustre]
MPGWALVSARGPDLVSVALPDWVAALASAAASAWGLALDSGATWGWPAGLALVVKPALAAVSDWAPPPVSAVARTSRAEPVSVAGSVWPVKPDWLAAPVSAAAWV